MPSRLDAKLAPIPSLPRPAVALPLPRLWLSDATGKRREVSETGGNVPQGRTVAFA
jgi:hypothetical protein